MKKNVMIIMTSIAVGIVCFVLIIFRKDKNKEYKEYYNIENIETVEYRWKDAKFVIADFTEHNKIDGFSSALLLEHEKNQYELLQLFEMCNYNKAKRIMKYYKNRLYIIGCRKKGFIDLDSQDFKINNWDLNLSQEIEVKEIIDINDTNMTLLVVYHDNSNKGQQTIKCNIDGTNCNIV